MMTMCYQLHIVSLITSMLHESTVFCPYSFYFPNFFLQISFTPAYECLVICCRKRKGSVSTPFTARAYIFHESKLNAALSCHILRTKCRFNFSLAISKRQTQKRHVEAQILSFSFKTLSDPRCGQCNSFTF